MMVIQNKPAKNTRGFTLVELVLAMAIVGIMLVAVTSSMVFSYYNTQYARAKVTVTNIANQKIEDIRSKIFTDIGNVGGNPAGAIPVSETIVMDGRTFTVTTAINWVDTSNGVSTNWDYKEVKIRVHGSGFFGTGKAIDKELSTIFTRNSEQPPLVGSHIRFHVYKGWGYSDPSNMVPVDNVKTKVGIYSVFANSSGLATFLGLTPATYQLDVDPAVNGMITLPGTYPKSQTIAASTTTEVVAQIERPVALHVSIKNAISKTPLVIPVATAGAITLLTPYGNDLAYNFSGTGSNGEIQNLPTAWSALWPVGSGYSGAYNVDIAPFPGLLISAYPLWDDGTNTPWDGTFSAPNTTKNVSVLYYIVPVPPADINPNSDEGQFSWTNGNSGVIDKTPSHKGIAYKKFTVNGVDEYRAIPYLFNTAKDWLKSENDTDLYNATELYFADPFEVKKTYSIAANKVIFQQSVTLKNGGTIIFNVLETVTIKPDGNTVVVPPASLGVIRTGGQIMSTLPEPYKSRKYGELYFVEDFVLNGNTIKKGFYYFPTGFDLATSYNKPASQGGLIAQ